LGLLFRPAHEVGGDEQVMLYDDGQIPTLCEILDAWKLFAYGRESFLQSHDGA
jgi:hypothetical protein